MPTRQGSIRLFRLFGITVYLHWSWFLVLVYFLTILHGVPPVLIVLVCVSLFAIVLMHEFGHQLACRQVGGQTHDIVLWPLGGVAYVSPPQRPGATLWSIAAGPLVNVLLFPIFGALFWLAVSAGWQDTHPEVSAYILYLFKINILLLFFNLLPIYPLDGGQILRSLLWFVFGKARSLMIASVIGFIGVPVLIGIAFYKGNPILGFICVFIVLNCWSGLMQARAMARMANAPRRAGCACPVCKAPPPVGAFWRCGRCRQPFDIFESGGLCARCHVQYTATNCPECGNLRPISEWSSAVPPYL
ncbi:MAG: site-2 protease family protein [Verrucomicrobiota bacterium]|nr:site-2 protease family protein [Verrucomicrobiota bacterium]